MAAKRPILPSKVVLQLRYYGKGYQTRIENMIQTLKAEVLRNYWPRSGRYCEARFLYRDEAMEKGIRHALKAEMLKKILAAKRPILPSKVVLSLPDYGKGYQTHTKSGDVKKVLAAKRPILSSNALLSLRDDGYRYEAMEKGIRHALNDIVY